MSPIIQCSKKVINFYLPVFYPSETKACMFSLYMVVFLLFPKKNYGPGDLLIIEIMNKLT